MELKIKKVATCGCSIADQEGTFAWAGDSQKAELIKLALEQFYGEVEKEEKK